MAEVADPNKMSLEVRASGESSAKRIYGLESVNRLTWITQIIWISQPLRLAKLDFTVRLLVLVAKLDFTVRLLVLMAKLDSTVRLLR